MSPVGEPNHQSLPSLSRESVVPLYFQLQELLKQEIEIGRWHADDRLPSEHDLAESFGVSRVVVRKALDVLRRDNQIYSVQGKGSFVGPPKIDYDGGGLSRLLTRFPQGLGSLRILECRTSSTEARVRTELNTTRSRLLRCVWVWSTRGMPVVLGDSHFIGITKRSFLTALGVDAAPADVDAERVRWPYELGQLRLGVEIGQAGSFSVAQLQVGREAPLFLVSVIESRLDGRRTVPFEFARIGLRSDALTIKLEMGSTQELGLSLTASRADEDGLGSNPAPPVGSS